jgi:porin
LALADEPASTTAPNVGFVSLRAAYTGELWTDIRGGLSHDAAYINTADVQVAVDLEQSLSWPKATFFFRAIATSNGGIAAKAGALQGISNIETGTAALSIEESWLDQGFADSHGSLRVGLYDVNSEFDAGEARALFLMPSHGLGAEFAQAGQNGPSTYPVTSLGARLNWNFEGGAYVRAAVLDGVPDDPAHPKRTTIDLSAADGALIIAEVGINEGARIWSLGAWTFTADFPDLVSAARQYGNRGAYVAIEEPLLSVDDCGFALAGSLRFGVANADVNPVSRFLGAALVATGLIAARPDDQLGVAVGVASVGAKYRGLIAAGGGDAASAEINVELTYNAQLSDWLIVEPDIQWVLNPNADRSVGDAIVAGFRLQFVKMVEFD